MCSECIVYRSLSFLFPAIQSFFYYLSKICFQMSFLQHSSSNSVDVLSTYRPLIDFQSDDEMRCSANLAIIIMIIIFMHFSQTIFQKGRNNSIRKKVVDQVGRRPITTLHTVVCNSWWMFNYSLSGTHVSHFIISDENPTKQQKKKGQVNIKGWK